MGYRPCAAILASLLDVACGARCVGCGARGVATPCVSCARELAALPTRRAAAFPDVGVARRLVRAAKFGHWRAGGRTLALHAVGRLPSRPVDLVTWVPAERSRRARRGGHLPEALARAWARELDVPCRGLLRRLPGPPQQGLNRAQRRMNVASVWRCAPGVDLHLLRGRRILLVDDVRTSGATLDAAGALLEACGSIVDRFAVVEHGTPAEIPARCEEFPLTTVAFPADSVLHDRRKDAPRVRQPRPP
jgi:predicted amidophosphoribosyltransferase